MSLDNISVVADAGRTRERSNPLARVFDDLMSFARSRSLFVLHYCTGCGAIELPPAMSNPKSRKLTSAATAPIRR